jgi:hypothetical protein
MIFNPTQLTNLVNQQAAQLRQLQASIQTLLARAAVASSSQSPDYPTSLIIPFSYIATIKAIPGMATQATVIQMASDSTFELLRMMAISSADVPANYFQNNFSVQLTDQSTGRQLSQDFIPQSCFVTNQYQFGGDEKYPILFPAQGIINLNFTNLTNAALTVNFVLKGYKIFQTSPTS